MKNKPKADSIVSGRDWIKLNWLSIGAKDPLIIINPTVNPPHNKITKVKVANERWTNLFCDLRANK